MKQVVIGPAVVAWVAAQMKRGEGYGLSTGIGLEENGDLIAGVVYNEFNGVNLCAHIAGVGKRWMTREYLWTIFDYAFNQCKVKRVTGFVEDENIAALRLDKKLGFKYEGRLKDAYVNGDILILVCRREDAQKWLDLKGRK